MPLHVLDIFPDGTARAATDETPAGPGAYRWWHFDLADPELPGWAQAHLPDRAAAALLDQETRPRCDPLGDGIILNLRAVNLNPGEAADQMASIRLWVAPGMIVTARMRRVFSLEVLRSESEAGDAPANPGAFLSRLVSLLSVRMRDQVLALEAELEQLETETEAEQDSDAPLALNLPRRRVIRFLRYLRPQRDAVLRLAALDNALVPADARLDLREGANQFVLATEALEAVKARLEALQDYEDARTAQRMTRNSYGLSLVAAIFLPLGFLTGLFGVNVGGMPGLDNPAAFALLCLGLAATGAVCVAILRWTRML